MAVYLFGFDYIFDFYYFRLALLSGLSGLYLRFLIHFINSENYARRAISLPIYPGLTDENLNEIITIIRYVLKNHDQV